MSTAAGALPRACAAEAIGAVRFDARSLKAVLRETLPRLGDARDRALCEAMVFQAVRFLPRYEFCLKRLLARPLPKAARTVHALLLAGLAQLDAMRLSDYAAISSTAEAARTLRQPRMVGLVNAVLRRFAREREALLAAAGQDAQARSCHPAWLVVRLYADWPQQAEAVMQANLEPAPMWLRVNLRQHTRAHWQQQLQQAGIESQASALAAAALRLDQARIPDTLPGWAQGAVSVQDESAQLAVPLLDLKAGQRVLDIGAAPGGKSAQILETCTGLAELVALDLDAARLAQVENTLARLGLSAHCNCICGDGARPETWWDGRSFDRILLDAPCSATGVIRRQPDIAWHRREADVHACVAEQARLLDAAWLMLRPGGRLVYSTCSVLRAENESQIGAFLSRTASARAMPVPEALGVRSGAGVQRFPQSGGGDGFFYAVLEKLDAGAGAADERLR